jgi:uncharacterized surface protein with fasciclin (FAS1) repeats
MLATLIIILFLAKLAICLPSMPPKQYLPALSDQLAQNNLNTLRSSTSHLCSVCVFFLAQAQQTLPLKVLAQINTTEGGAAFLSSLYSDQGFTVYAPTDQAFEGYAYNPSNVDAQNPFYLQDVLKYHVCKLFSGLTISQLNSCLYHRSFLP